MAKNHINNHATSIRRVSVNPKAYDKVIVLSELPPTVGFNTALTIVLRKFAGLVENDSK